MEKLAIFTQAAAPHVVFGWFNLVWPDIAFWIAVIAAFFVLAWARIPPIMDADAESRRNGVDR
jgi:hypothetical protein